MGGLINVNYFFSPTTIKIPDSVRTSFVSPKQGFLGARPKNGFTRGSRTGDLESVHSQAAAAAVIIGSLKIVSHFENGRFEVIITLPRSYRSAKSVKRTSILSLP
jgi:hypothetical protein